MQPSNNGTTAPGADEESVWLVTGSSSGFGRAITGALRARRRRVVATARRVDAMDHLRDDDPFVLKAALDVTDPETIAAAVELALDRFGRIDVVVNNAGIGVIGPVEDVSDAQTRAQFEVNLFGLLAVTRAVQPTFRAQRRGLFVNFSSMAGEQSLPSLGIYSASKFAVEGLSEAVRDEMRPYGVGVMIVEPGPFDTEWIGRNAIWADRTERYPAVWDAVAHMKAAYADRKVVGDPARAADAILTAVAMNPMPFRLPLHEMSVESTRAKLGAVAADLDATASLSARVHYA